ncbi:MAG: MerR family transcriptional regulator [Gammaproteobacteria bacterium]|jgi:chaperone modulatory protein CbpM|nr:MAG: MerR family transcriptional regulator [Gammaproteobacteria bacterium]HDN69225.1 MerR family transcriptional regulator [Gammaproteobacteria bacterium]
MMTQRTDILTGIILEEEIHLSLRELCDACAVHAEFITELVNEGVIEPSGFDKSHWCFSGVSLHRIRAAKHLQRDLGVNLAGVALALDLLDEMQRLHTQLQKLSGPEHE